MAAGESLGYRDASYASKRRSETSFLPAPTRGINASDPPDRIDLGYADEIDNMWPEQNGLSVRGGSIPWNLVGDPETPVHSLMCYDAQILFAVSGESVYQLTETATSSGQATEVKTGLTANARMQSVSFGNAGLTFLCCCNGVDAPFYFNGTEWVTPSFTLNSEAFDASVFNSVTTHLQRLWWTANDSQTVYFGDVSAVQGPLHELPLGGFMRRGGSIVAIGTITQDGLSGSDDLFVAISSEGEVFLYKGDNPQEIDGFTLIGRGQIPRPIGYPRCTTKFGTDLIVMTEAGIVGLNASLSSVFPGLRTNIMEKIEPLWEQYVGLFGRGSGWDIALYHKRGTVVINLPAEVGCRQFVVHPDTSAWTTLSGWEHINCFIEYKGELLGGGTGNVLRLDTLHTDFVNGTVVPVRARVKHSPYALGQTGIKKRFTLAKPFIISSSTPESFFGIVTDFGKEPVLSKMFDADETYGGFSKWYIAEWHSSEWTIGDTTYRAHTRWMQALGSGYFVAPIVEFETQEQGATYAGVELQYEVSNTI